MVVADLTPIAIDILSRHIHTHECVSKKCRHIAPITAVEADDENSKI